LLESIRLEPHVHKGNLVPDPQAVLALASQTYADLVRDIFRVLLERSGKRRWGDKTPSYTADSDVLWRLFPDCKIVHLVRDGRDVALSMRAISWGTRNMIRLAEDWRWKVTICHKVGLVLGDDYYLMVRYEDLVRDTESMLRRICAFLGEPFDPQMLDYHHKARTQVPLSSLAWHRSSVSPPDPAKIDAWKRQLPASDQIIFAQIAGATLRTLGYDVETPKSTVMSRVKNLYYTGISRW
jgi:hypothetical protein